MAIREYNNIFSVSKMFETKEDVRDFFEWVCQYIAITCKEIEKNKDKKNTNFPVIYSHKQEVLSISFNFFIDCIAKFFDAGNQDIEEKIKKGLLLTNTKDMDDSEEGARLTRARTLIVVDILQDFYNIVHPNNTRINMTYLKGSHTITSSYYIAMVYEDIENNPIQYAMIPLKTKKLNDLGIDEDLVFEAVNYGRKLKMKDVAFNMRNVNLYWEKSEKKVKRYD